MPTVSSQRIARSSSTFSVLIVDDDPREAHVSLTELRRGRTCAQSLFAANERELRSALQTFATDVIVCNFHLNGFDGLAAQRIANDVQPDTPLIFVANWETPDDARIAMESGAAAYLLKADIQRLPYFVRVAVRDARERVESARRAARTQRHATRLEALWRIVNAPDVSATELLHAMLLEATTAIRPGHAFIGSLGHIEGAEFVLDTLAGDFSAAGSDALRLLQPGTRFACDQTLQARDLTSDRTHAWDDCQALPDLPQRVRDAGVRSQISTRFDANGVTHTLTFNSLEWPSTTPFNAHDTAYVELLGSFFARQLERHHLAAARAAAEARARDHTARLERLWQVVNDPRCHGLELTRAVLREGAASIRPGQCFRGIVDRIDADHIISIAIGHEPDDLTARASLPVAGARSLRQNARMPIGARTQGRMDDAALPGARTGPEGVAWRAAVQTQFQATGSTFVLSLVSADATATPFSDEDLSYLDAIASALAKQFEIESLETSLRDEEALCWVFYEAGMEGEAQRHAVLHNDLVKALADNQFELYYQPHITLGAGDVTGCEALIRWNHPVHGLLLPSQFIPYAEQSGLISSIDAWVMNAAFASANELARAQPGIRLYFNLSGRQAGASRLVRAFTDAMRDIEATRRVCRALRRLNVRIAIDDFGTGYSSLSSLKRLPVDIVKIDRSFVAGLAGDAHDQTITETIISISERFGFESLAEGVETAAELTWLREHGCGYVQGFAISPPPPLPLAGFLGWLAGHEEFG